MRSTGGAVALLTLSLTALPDTRLAGLAQEIPGADSKTAAHLKAEHLAYVIANVDTLMADWRSAWSSKNAAGMAALYAESALLIPSGGAPIVGREAIRRHYEEALRPAGDIGVSVGDVGVGEEIAYLFGDYRFGGPGVWAPRHDPDAIWPGLANPGPASASCSGESASRPCWCNGGEPGTADPGPTRAKDGTDRQSARELSEARLHRHERCTRDVEGLMAPR